MTVTALFSIVVAIIFCQSDLLLIVPPLSLPLNISLLSNVSMCSVCVNHSVHVSLCYSVISCHLVCLSINQHNHFAK